VINDAIAYIKSLAQLNDRNISWAIDAVKEAKSISAEDALRYGVIDLMAEDTNALMHKLEGRKITLAGKPFTLKTKNATIEHFEANWKIRLLGIITNPNIAYILMMLGMLGLTLELYNPGAILPGVVSGISLILGLYAMETLSVNYAGILLIIFAVILFLLEIKIPSFGVLSIGGVISLVAGSVGLFDSNLPFLHLSWKVIFGVVLTSSLFFILLIGMVVRTHRKRPTTGIEGMKGEIGEVYKTLNPQGTIRVHGEFWKAICDHTIKKGQRVEVLEVDRKTLLLKVKSIK